jgi:hypothetical protein
MQWHFLDVVKVYLALGSTVLQAATYEVAQNHPGATDDGPGTPERPWKSITKAALIAKAGDLVLVGEGVYRERVLVKNHGTAQEPIRFEAAPGAHVVLTGADRLTSWQKTRENQPVYRVPWPHRFITWSKHMTHPDDEYHRLIGRCEQVSIENRLLRQVLDIGQLAPGTFFVDTTNGILHAWDSGNRDQTRYIRKRPCGRISFESKAITFECGASSFVCQPTRHSAARSFYQGSTCGWRTASSRR